MLRLDARSADFPAVLYDADSPLELHFEGDLSLLDRDLRILFAPGAPPRSAWDWIERLKGSGAVFMAFAGAAGADWLADAARQALGPSRLVLWADDVDSLPASSGLGAGLCLMLPPSDKIRAALLAASGVAFLGEANGALELLRLCAAAGRRSAVWSGHDAVWSESFRREAVRCGAHPVRSADEADAALSPWTGLWWI